MDKISFIIYKTDEAKYQRLVNTLVQVHIPAGFTADIITVEGDKGIAAAYNEGMKRSDARYKVYIREDCVILNPKFLIPLVKALSLDKKIGIAGFSGTMTIPTNAMCIDSLHRVGMFYDESSGEKKQWGILSSLYLPVKALDGYFLMTQYDVPWREDLFSSESYYDTAQCQEFSRRGYQVVAVKQEEPMIGTEMVSEKAEEDGQDAFLDEYSKELFPLVSVVIPTYNRPRYLREALESVLQQTYRNLEIFITDNSHNDETEQMMGKYFKQYDNIMYEHHADFDVLDNWHRARSYNNPKAEYVNWLMDDDLFMPEKISVMMNYYLMNQDISLVTSSRKLIDKEGNALPIPACYKSITDKTMEYDGIETGKVMFTSLNNFIGEPTTVLIKKELLNAGDLGWTGNEGRYLISDFPTWLNALTKGNMIYIAEPLSCFRQHDGQDQKNIQTQINGAICWGLELKYAIDNRIFLTDKNIIRIAILKWLRTAAHTLWIAAKQYYNNIDIDNLQQAYIDMAQALDGNHEITFQFDTSIHCSTDGSKPKENR